ncbi:hypothetical protein CSHISOI_04880 [Colletotrichum shisoi]|uniref:Uncharacterized protein n=1 Tax=Colletotrichum shisoi TaxID=2078593 RepID=A0A5Q4BVU9_9PEZI|nr:hypothetical protein CSHISOI_04880 [Colletotrichum shisoi]
MAVVAQSPMVVDGLHVPPTIEGLKLSSLAYNLLPDDGDQPEVQQVRLQKLADLFKRFNVEDKFGMHLIHGHFQLDEGTVMLGTALASVRGCWTKPTRITDLKSTEIHGHIFRLTEAGDMRAYEYRDGPPTNLDSVDPTFFHELVEYLRVNNLTEILGLEVLAEEVPEMMCEFILKDNGTVMLDARDAKKWTSYRFTGFAVSEPGMNELKGNQSHAKTVRNTHQVFTDGKICKEDVLMDVLRAEDIVH